MNEIRQYENMNYILRFPEGYEVGERRPVIIFLHGAGSRGSDISNLASNPFFRLIEKHADFPFVVAAPLCSKDTWFDMFETLKRFVADIAAGEYTDREKMYLMGASMGGYGTWQLAMSMPQYFKAIVPICGGGMYWNAGRLKNVPVWAFHGEKDPVVSVDESRKMVDAVNRHGGSAHLTVYPENAHDAWSDTYGNYEVFEWLLAH